MMILAEIADKMPTVEMMWMRMLVWGVITAATTFVFTLVSRTAGLIVLILVAGFSLFWNLPQGSWDALVARELGQSYLNHLRASGFVPLVFSFMAWLMVRRWSVPRAD